MVCNNLIGEYSAITTAVQTPDHNTHTQAAPGDYLIAFGFSISSYSSSSSSSFILYAIIKGCSAVYLQLSSSYSISHAALCYHLLLLLFFFCFIMRFSSSSTYYHYHRHPEGGLIDQLLHIIFAFIFIFCYINQK